MNNEYDLQRFITAQDLVYSDALGTLRRGIMCTRYLEIIFPRLAARRRDAGPDPTPSHRSTKRAPTSHLLYWAAAIGNALACCNGWQVRVPARSSVMKIRKNCMHL